MRGAREGYSAVALILLTIGASGCMQAIDPKHGYALISKGSLAGTNYGSSFDNLRYPRGLAVDAAGDVFIVDSGNDRIVKIPAPDPIANKDTTTWSFFPTSNTPTGDFFTAPEGIAVDSTGANIWVADAGNGLIVHLKSSDWATGNPTFDQYPSVSVSGGSHDLTYPTGLALHANVLYLTDPGSDFPFDRPSVFAIDVSTLPASGSPLNGIALVSGSGGGTRSFSYPRGIAADASGVYIADETNYRIIRMDLSLSPATWETLGTRGSGVFQFISPQALALDGAGGVFVVDSGNYRVVKTRMDLTAWTEFGAQTGTTGSSVYPNWVAVDSSSTIYVADDTNDQVAAFR